MKPDPKEIQQLIGAAAKMDAAQTTKVDRAFERLIEAANQGAMGLAVTAYARAETTIEREDSIRAVAAISCLLDVTRMVLIGAVPPGPRAEVLGTILRATAGELSRFDKAYREAMPSAVAERSAFIAELHVADWWCGQCQRFLNDYDLEAKTETKVCHNCRGDIVKASSLLVQP
jgi:hypothetical protein